MTANPVRNSASPRPLALLAAVAASSLAVFIVSNLGPLNHNDFMYAVAPAVWAQNGDTAANENSIRLPRCFCSRMKSDIRLSSRQDHS